MDAALVSILHNWMYPNITSFWSGDAFLVMSVTFLTLSTINIPLSNLFNKASDVLAALMYLKSTWTPDSNNFTLKLLLSELPTEHE